MPSSIIKTKINVPALKRNFVLRKRISGALSDGIRDGRKLTLISAPAGFGKTSLVCEWLETCEVPAAWFSIDEGDGEAARFLTYIIAALQTLISGIGDGILGTLQSSPSASTKELATSLLNELDSAEDDFILVLDDYHALASSAADELLTFLVEHMPQQMHLVITTREDPALPLARLRAKNQLTEIRAAELRFTESEAANFLNQVMGLNLSTEDIAVLEARTEGWIAGLQLAALSIQGKPDRTGFIRSFRGTHQFVLDYLLKEVLQKQPEPLQEFLLHTSILNRLSGSLCDALWQSKNTSAQETLEHLERANLFVMGLDDERRWYRYHHLFRDLLRQRLSQKRSKEEISKIHLRASAWFEQSGEIGEAFHHAVAAADFDRAARLAETSWLAMDESFQTGTWLGWVNQLPLGVIRVRPVLCAQIGWAHMDAGNVDASESSLRDAERCIETSLNEMSVVEKEQFQALPARIAIARAYNAQSQERFSDAVKYAEMALDLLPGKDDFVFAQASTTLSFTHWANGNLDHACALMSNWIEASTQAGNYFFAIASASGKADILTAQGRLRDVLQTYQQAFEFAAAHHAEQYTAHHHLGMGMLYHEMGEDERASRYLQKAFQLGRQTTIVDWAYRKSLAQAHWEESEGDLNSALGLLDEAQRFYVRTPIPNLRPVHAMKARIYLKQGNLLKAQEWAGRTGLSLHDDSNYLHEFEQVTLARIALVEYQHKPSEPLLRDVLNLLERLKQKAEEQNRLRSRIEILIVQSLAFYLKKDTPAALTSLKQALALAEPEGYLRIFVAEDKPMVAMLSKLKDGRLNPYAERILAFLEPPENAQPAPLLSQPLIEPLSEREREVLRLIAQGLSNQEITRKLFVALSTVKGHNLRIFAKLQAKSRTEAVARARELGLL